LCYLLVWTLRWVGSPLLLLVLTQLVGGVRRMVHQYFSGALLDEAATTFLFLLSLCMWILSSTMIALLTNSGKVPPMLSARHSCSLVETSFIKWPFFFSSVSTCSRAYCARWLKSFEYSYTDLPPCFRSMNSGCFLLMTPTGM
jgi:hypothetical protein